ncbi:hypothetical protein [Arenicella xantha]|nr:hypothetical protein [Arenicella xantha]
MTKIVLFGGNIVFGFHSDGEQKSPKFLLSQAHPNGFNCCVDLLYAKKHGEVKRVASITSIEKYWLTKFAKSPIYFGSNLERTWGWKIYSIKDLKNIKKIRIFLFGEHKQAMDYSCCGFLFYIQLVERKYLLGQSMFLNEN